MERNRVDSARLMEANQVAGAVIARATELMGISDLPKRDKETMFEPNIRRWIDVTRAEFLRGVAERELLAQLDDYDREHGSLLGAVPWKVFCCGWSLGKIRRRRWAIGTKQDDAHDQAKRDLRREEYRPPPRPKPTALDLLLGAMLSKGHAGLAAELRSVIMGCRRQGADEAEMKRRIEAVLSRRKAKVGEPTIARIVKAAGGGAS